VPFVDSVDKIVMTYFASVTKQDFIYKKVIYQPRPLVVSPLILRGFTCPMMCGGCCPRFSLDYLPNEKKPANLTLRQIAFCPHPGTISQPISIYSDLQSDHQDHFCRNLNKQNGRCNIYEVRPFSCDFELIRFFISADKSRLSQQLFGRGWNFLRVDGDRGALCSMTPVSVNTITETLRKLNRLQMWANHFQIFTWVPEIIDWIHSGDTSHHLKLEL
jgi:Fe-S-cluster containining protein